MDHFFEYINPDYLNEPDSNLALTNAETVMVDSSDHVVAANDQNEIYLDKSGDYFEASSYEGYPGQCPRQLNFNVQDGQNGLNWQQPQQFLPDSSQDVIMNDMASEMYCGALETDIVSNSNYLPSSSADLCLPPHRTAVFRSTTQVTDFNINSSRSTNQFGAAVNRFQESQGGEALSTSSRPLPAAPGKKSRRIRPSTAKPKKHPRNDPNQKFPGMGVFDPKTGGIPSSRKRTDAQKMEMKELEKAGNTCFLCKLKKKKCSPEKPCYTCRAWISKHGLDKAGFDWACDVRTKFIDMNVFLFDYNHAHGLPEILSVPANMDYVLANLQPKLNNIYSTNMDKSERRTLISTVISSPAIQILIQTNHVIRTPLKTDLCDVEARINIYTMRATASLYLFSWLDMATKQHSSSLQIMMSFLFMACVLEEIERKQEEKVGPELSMTDHLRRALLCHIQLFGSILLNSRRDNRIVQEKVVVVIQILLLIPELRGSVPKALLKGKDWKVFKNNFDKFMEEESEKTLMIEPQQFLLLTPRETPSFSRYTSIILALGPNFLLLFGYTPDSLLMELLLSCSSFEFDFRSVSMINKYETTVMELGELERTDQQIFRVMFYFILDAMNRAYRFSKLPRCYRIRKVLFHVAFTHTLGEFYQICSDPNWATTETRLASVIAVIKGETWLHDMNALMHTEILLLYNHLVPLRRGEEVVFVFESRNPLTERFYVETTTNMSNRILGRQLAAQFRSEMLQSLPYCEKEWKQKFVKACPTIGTIKSNT